MLPSFLEPFQSTVISTLDNTKAPFTSYAPFIQKDNDFYIFISDIAKHAKNIQRGKQCSLFFIEDESQAKNIFARQRVVLQCEATKIAKDNEVCEELLNTFEEKFGDIMNMLKEMKDFNLYKITPLKGEAVFGFAEAFDIECNPELCLVERENQKGHNSK